MGSTTTNTMISPVWQNVDEKVMTAIQTGGSSLVRSLNAIYGESPRSYSFDQYQFSRKYTENKIVSQVVRGGDYINISGEKETKYQFNPLIYKLSTGYPVVDLQLRSAITGEAESQEAFRTPIALNHVRTIRSSLNASAIVSRRGGEINTPVLLDNGQTIYTNQNYGKIWSDSVGAAAFSTRMQNGVTITSVDWGNASTTLAMIETSIADIVKSAEDKGLNPSDLDFWAGSETFTAIGTKIDAYASTTKRNGSFDYSIDRIGGVIQIGTTTIKRLIDSCVIGGVTYKFVEDKYITVSLKPMYNDWVYMCPEDIKNLYTPIEYWYDEVIDSRKTKFEVLTQSRQFICPDTNGIFTVKVISG